LNYHYLQDGGFSISLKLAEEKTKKPQNPPKGLTVLKEFAVPALLNIFRLKMGGLNPEGDNNDCKKKTSHKKDRG
jgi:hypothetical protein